MWVAGRIQSLPGWLRAPVAGALFLGAIVLARIVFAIPRLLKSTAEVGELLMALGAAMAAGAAGGLVYSAVRPPLRRLGMIGDYLTGIAVVAGYIGALIVAARSGIAGGPDPCRARLDSAGPWRELWRCETSWSISHRPKDLRADPARGRTEALFTRPVDLSDRHLPHAQRLVGE